MFRNLFRILAIILVLALARYLYYLVKKAFRDAMGAAAGEPAAKGTAAQGELHRDPVCGTFVPADSGIQLTAGGVTHHFCSAACRDKFKAA
jgi:YHS domain-containing protein